MVSRPLEIDFKAVEKVGLSSGSVVLLALLISLTLGCSTPPRTSEPGLEHVRE